MGRRGWPEKLRRQKALVAEGQEDVRDGHWIIPLAWAAGRHGTVASGMEKEQLGESYAECSMGHTRGPAG